MVTSESTPNTWAHVAAIGAHYWHGTVVNGIEVVSQSASHDPATGVSPTVENLKPQTSRYTLVGNNRTPLTNEGMI